MEEMTKRELAFCYIYSQEIQGQNSKSLVKLFLDSTEVENGRARNYYITTEAGTDYLHRVYRDYLELSALFQDVIEGEHS